MVGQWGLFSGGDVFGVPLLAFLTIRQQATPRFRSVNPVTCRGLDRAGSRGHPEGETAHRAWAGPGLKPIQSFKGWGFRGLRLRPGLCRTCPPSYIGLTVAVLLAFDHLRAWTGA